MDTWVDKYKPKCLNDIIMNDQVREMFKGYLESDSIFSMTLSGTAGIGKTTTARVLAESLPNCNIKYINASDENGIDVVRTKIKEYVEVSPMFGGIKVIILDEADGLTKDGQNCMRNIMESDMEDTRFILTCNDESKIIDPIKSRCPVIDLTYTMRDAIRRIFEILIAEGISVEKYQNEVMALVKKYFPDMRKTIHMLERSFVNGQYCHLDEHVLAGGAEVVDFVMTNIKDHAKCRKHWLEFSGKFNNDYVRLGGMLLNQFEDPMMLLYLGDKHFQLNVVTDKEIGFYQMVLALQQYGKKG